MDSRVDGTVIIFVSVVYPFAARILLAQIVTSWTGGLAWITHNIRIEVARLVSVGLHRPN